MRRTAAVAAALAVAVAMLLAPSASASTVAAPRHLRRRGRAVRRARPRLPAAEEDGDAAPARQPLVVGAGDQRRDPQAEAPRRPERSGLQLGHLRPHGAVLDRQRHPADLLRHRHAALGERGQGMERRAHQRARPPELRGRGAEALQRVVRQRGRRHASAREPLDGLERAEQPGLPEAAVPAHGQDLDDPVGPRLREDVQRGRAGGSSRCSARRRSRAAPPARGGTTTRTRAVRPSRRSRSCAR